MSSLFSSSIPLKETPLSPSSFPPDHDDMDTAESPCPSPPLLPLMDSTLCTLLLWKAMRQWRLPPTRFVFLVWTPRCSLRTFRHWGLLQFRSVDMSSHLSKTRDRIGNYKSTKWFNLCARFFPISGFYTNLPFPHQGKKEVACIVSKPLVSCLWGCGESVNPPQLNIQEIQGGFVL